MTDSVILLELAERCEAASGPCFKLETDIAYGIDAPLNGIAKPYTASLDAAMTLVPQGLAWMCANSFSWGAYADTWDGNGVGPPRCIAATPALALSAAALRARAAIQPVSGAEGECR